VTPRPMRTDARRALVVGGLLVLLAAPAAAETRLYVVDPARSQIRFHAVSRLMDADGTFSRFGGEIRLDDERMESAAGRVTIEVASLDTGVRMRDDHLRGEDFFAVDRHPRATFVVSGVHREGERVTVSGDLTIRGVTRRVSAPVTASVRAGTLRVAGELTLNRRDFGIAYQSWLNPIRDEATVRFDLMAVSR
jgi:polyisoprenoid-binding protein YceI